MLSDVPAASLLKGRTLPGRWHVYTALFNGDESRLAVDAMVESCGVPVRPRLRPSSQRHQKHQNQQLVGGADDDGAETHNHMTAAAAVAIGADATAAAVVAEVEPGSAVGQQHVDGDADKSGDTSGDQTHQHGSVVLQRGRRQEQHAATATVSNTQQQRPRTVNPFCSLPGMGRGLGVGDGVLDGLSLGTDHLQPLSSSAESSYDEQSRSGSSSSSSSSGAVSYTHLTLPTIYSV